MFVNCQLCIEKTKIKKKKPGMAHFLKNTKKQLVLHYHVSAGLNLHNYEYRMRVCNFRFMGKLFCFRLNEKTIVGTL